MFGACIVVQYFVFFLVVQSCCWGNGSWLIDFYCLLDVLVLYIVLCFVCLFLLLYVPCQQLWSLRDGQFT